MILFHLQKTSKTRKRVLSVLNIKIVRVSLLTYYPDFFVKVDDKQVYIIETKGREDEDDKIKFERLQKWCDRCK
jgi:hypothetical protein